MSNECAFISSHLCFCVTVSQCLCQVIPVSLLSCHSLPMVLILTTGMFLCSAIPDEKATLPRYPRTKGTPRNCASSLDPSLTGGETAPDDGWRPLQCSSFHRCLRAKGWQETIVYLQETPFYVTTEVVTWLASVNLWKDSWGATPCPPHYNV